MLVKPPSTIHDPVIVKTLQGALLGMTAFFAFAVSAAAGFAQPPEPVPENGATWLLLAIAIGGLIALRRKLAR